ncbi:hypothetical protein AAFF_G00359470 [Aldrovandia affinis]|uniref:Uncharacterized protein n=1 Tax=Aldrovandia affinis TaxID=143900 RepID=A0AAD7WN07_9TELE|nr:hypothetical protein AAFF_G00359470 [Aldrovandia affinis]
MAMKDFFVNEGSEPYTILPNQRQQDPQAPQKEPSVHRTTTAEHQHGLQEEANPVRPCVPETQKARRAPCTTAVHAHRDPRDPIPTTTRLRKRRPRSDLDHPLARTLPRRAPPSSAPTKTAGSTGSPLSRGAAGSGLPYTART